MAKIKKFTVLDYYEAFYPSTGSRSSETKIPVPISIYSDLAKQANNFILENNDKSLINLLQSEYVEPIATRHYTEVKHHSYDYSGAYYNGFGGYGGHPYSFYAPQDQQYNQSWQKNTYTYAEHLVSPFLEELVTNHQSDFVVMLAQASPECKKALLDFTNLDLNHANLREIDLTDANLTGCQLKNTLGITQEKLDQSLTYDGADLADDLVPFWSKDKKKTVLEGIDSLEKYGQELIEKAWDEEGKTKGSLAKNLAAELRGKINATAQYNGAFQEDFLKCLHQHDDAFAHKRFYGIKTIIINISLFVMGFGALYAIAGASHAALTGRFAFYNRTETEQKIAKIDNSIGLSM